MKYLKGDNIGYHTSRESSLSKIDFSKSISVTGSQGSPIKKKAHGKLSN